MGTRVEFDFQDPSILSQFPAHGWAFNSQEIRILRLPILRLFGGHPFGFQELRKQELTVTQMDEFQAFTTTLNKLVLNHAELARHSKIVGNSFDEEMDLDKLGESLHSNKLIPLYLDLNFVYLRRVADNFTRALRLIAFKKNGSAPHKYMDMLDFIEKYPTLERLEPRFDPAHLISAYKNYSNWVRLLRGAEFEGKPGQKGIRDILEHYSPVVDIQFYQDEGKEKVIQAFIRNHKKDREGYPDLFETTRRIIHDMCLFYSEICKWAIQQNSGFTSWSLYTDAVLTAGIGDHSHMFWPEIGK